MKAKPSVSKPTVDAADDDPFSIDRAVAEKAIRLRPRPVKGGTFQVVCPMCETVGYAPPRAAGHEVRCANPQCLVPLFTAPELPKEEPVETEPPRSHALKIVYAVVALLLLAGVGVGAWLITSGGDVPQRPPGEEHLAGHSGDPGDALPSEDVAATKTPPGDGATTAAPQPKELTPAEIRDRALPLMIETSRQNAQNRSKPYCRRLTAEAFASVGRIEEARTQIEQLQVVGPELPYYRIPPLVLIAWQELASGDEEAAKADLQAAWTAGEKLPTFGRDPLDMATQLAAGLVGIGRQDDAARLIKSLRPQPEIARLSLQVQAARAFETYDLDEQLASEPIYPVATPTWSAVTLGAAGHGRWEAALAWAESHSDAESRTDAVITWAEAAAIYKEGSNPVEGVTAAAQKLSPPARAKLFARVAVRLLAAGRSTEAEEALKSAKTALSEVAVPEPVAMPSLEEIYNLELIDRVPLRTAALAAAETARVEAQLGRAEEAGKSLDLAMRFARGMAPSPAAVRKPADDVDRAANAVKSQVAAALGLTSEDESRRALNTYRRQVRALADASASRFELQVAIFSRAAGWGEAVRDQVWEEVQSRIAEPSLDEREPFDGSAVPSALIAGYRRAGANDKAVAVEGATPGAQGAADPYAALEEEVASLAAANTLAQAAAKIEASNLERSLKYRLALATACRAVKERGFSTALGFVQRFRDPILREEGFELIAALAARQGERQAVWKAAEEASLPPTERVAVCRGLLAGMQASSAGGPESETAGTAAAGGLSGAAPEAGGAVRETGRAG